MITVFSGNCHMVDISHTSYSPNLTPSHFFLLPKVKTVIKGRFQKIAGVRKNIMAELNAVPLDAFNDFFCATSRHL
jgi:hypothetical protein